MMALRLNVLTVFLFLVLALTVSAKNSGNSKKKRPSPVKLSDNISKNPFLQNITQSGNIDKSPFHQGGGAVNWNNIFLPPSTKPPSSHSNNEMKQNQVSFANNGTKATADGDNTSFVAHSTNPFLQNVLSGGINAAIPFTNNTNSNTNPVTEKITYVDEIPDKKGGYGGTKRRSELMCEEYGKQISVQSSVLPLVSHSSAITLNIESCTETNQLVVGGVTATPGEFPHMVALGHKTEDGVFKILCGGTLIAPEWVLTAAHCTHHSSSTDIRIGFHDLRDTEYGISTTINKTIRHPNYKPPSIYDDIALIKLNKLVTFNNRIRPACLYERYDRLPLQAWVSGWGVLEFEADEGSNTLQKAELKLIDNIRCSLKHRESSKIPYGITPNMVCAGDPTGGWSKDTCQGDSGGPLQIVHPENKCLFQVLGVTSFGQGCAFVGMPGVYTKVSHYIDWIEDIVWPKI